MAFHSFPGQAIGSSYDAQKQEHISFRWLGICPPLIAASIADNDAINTSITNTYVCLDFKLRNTSQLQQSRAVLSQLSSTDKSPDTKKSTDDAQTLEGTAPSWQSGAHREFVRRPLLPAAQWYSAYHPLARALRSFTGLLRHRYCLGGLL